MKKIVKAFREIGIKKKDEKALDELSKVTSAVQSKEDWSNDTYPLVDYDFKKPQHVSVFKLQDTAPFNWERATERNSSINIDINNYKASNINLIEKQKSKELVQNVCYEKKTSLSLQAENNLFQDNFQRVESFDWEKYSGLSILNPSSTENHLPISLSKNYYKPVQVVESTLIIQTYDEDNGSFFKSSVTCSDDTDCLGDSSSYSDQS
jgi:hypothetical protein